MRKNPKLSGTTHNIFGIQVGVGITILVRRKASTEHFIRYHRVPEDARKVEKLYWMEQVEDFEGVEWQTLKPNSKNAWITEGLIEDFDTFIPLGTKEAKAGFSSESKTVFKLFSNGIKSNRDEWVWDFQRETLKGDVTRFITEFNAEVNRWQESDYKTMVDDFVSYSTIKWSEGLKTALRRGEFLTLEKGKIRSALYRPFCKQLLYFDTTLNERTYQQPKSFPTSKATNLSICVTATGNQGHFHCLMTDCIPDLHVTGDSQCFSLYTYIPDGVERFDNITGFALKSAQEAYGDLTTREDIFYATYALLHHPTYRTKYAENLKRELPRLPLGSDAISPTDWKILVEVGRELGDLHVNYESATPYPLDDLDTTEPGKTFSFRVEKMRFDKAKTQLKVNDSIMLSGFTPEMFDYKLGNRSALDWVVESYRVKRDDRSGLVSDPNRPDEPRYIIDLICRVATVSLETQKLIAQLPPQFDQE